MSKVPKSAHWAEQDSDKSGVIRECGKYRRQMNLRLTERQYEALRWLAGYFDMSMSAVARIAIIEMRERVVGGMMTRGYLPEAPEPEQVNKYYRVTYPRRDGSSLITLIEAESVQRAGAIARRILALHGEGDAPGGWRLDALSVADYRESWGEAVTALSGTLEHSCALLALFGDGLAFDDDEGLRAVELLLQPHTNGEAFTAARDLLARCMAMLAADTGLKLDVEAGLISPLALAREVYGS